MSACGDGPQPPDYATEKKLAAIPEELKALKAAVCEIRQYTDLWPWYWLSYGEKCYAFATVEAFPENDADEFPKPGSELVADPDNGRLWIGENGTRMIVESHVAEIERQNGDTICKFIAMAHAKLVKPLA